MLKIFGFGGRLHWAAACVVTALVLSGCIQTDEAWYRERLRDPFTGEDMTIDPPLGVEIPTYQFIMESIDAHCQETPSEIRTLVEKTAKKSFRDRQNVGATPNQVTKEIEGTFLLLRLQVFLLLPGSIERNCTSLIVAPMPVD